MLSREIVERIEHLGWEIHGSDEYGAIELERLTPAGEDWIVVLNVGPDGGAEDLTRDSFYCYDSFDIGEELGHLLQYRGQRGVPDSVFTLFADQVWKEIELDKLQQTVRFDEDPHLDGLLLDVYKALSAIA